MLHAANPMFRVATRFPVRVFLASDWSCCVQVARLQSNYANWHKQTSQLFHSTLTRRPLG